MSVMKATMKAGKQIKQMQKVQAGLKVLKKEMEAKTFTHTHEGVRVEMHGHHRITKIDAPEGTALEALQAAINATIEHVDEIIDVKTKAISEGKPGAEYVIEN